MNVAQGLCAAMLLTGASSVLAVDVIPYREGIGGNPAAIVTGDVAWRSGDMVAMSAATTKPEVETKWVAFHDDAYLYVAVDCLELPEQMAVIGKRAKYGNGSPMVAGRESLEINFDPTGKGLSFYKFAVNPQGDFCEYRCVDDNTGMGRYVFTRKWSSGARLAVRQETDRWTVRLAIPLGAIEGVRTDPAAEWRFGLARQRLLDKVGFRWAVSAPASGFNDILHYPTCTLERTAKLAKAWEIVPPETSVRPDGTGGLALATRFRAKNLGPSESPVHAKVTVRDRNGVVMNAAEREVSASCGESKDVLVSVPNVRKGEATVCVELLAGDGRIERGVWRDVRIDYEPVKIRFSSPFYRDCVFETMHLTEVSGTVVLEEDVGKPLEIRFEGPDTRDCVRFASASVTNRFAFPFVGKAKGDYWLVTDRAKRRLRNLPYLKNEVWIDRDGVVWRDGEKMMPFGWFSETFNHPHPSLSIAQTYWNTMGDQKDGMRALCGESFSNHCGFIASPFQSLPDVKRDDIFSWKLLEGEFGVGKVGEMQKKAVVAMVETVKDHPGFMAYYMADEPEGFNTNPEFLAEARAFVTELDPYHPTIVVNFSTEGVERYHDCADIMCPDCYPTYFVDGTTRDRLNIAYERPKVASACGAGWMSPQAFDWHITVPNKPTSRGPTYDELRAQVLMGLCADARGFLLFSRQSCGLVNWHLWLGTEYVGEELLESKDVFLSPTLDVRPELEPAGADVIAGMKSFGDDLAVIIVNNESRSVRVTFRDARLPRELHLDGERVAAGGCLSIVLGARESRVYRSRPQAFSPSAARVEIARREAARRKPGNLCAPKRFYTLQEQQMINEGKLSYDFPRIVASSSDDLSHRPHVFPHLLQDGFDQTFPYVSHQAWSPKRWLKDHWVRAEFGDRKRIGRVVLYRGSDREGRFAIDSGWLELNGRKVAEFANPAAGRVELAFPAEEADSVTFHPGPRNPDARPTAAYLVEFEVYEK